MRDLQILKKEINRMEVKREQIKKELQQNKDWMLIDSLNALNDKLVSYYQELLKVINQNKTNSQKINTKSSNSEKKTTQKTNGLTDLERQFLSEIVLRNGNGEYILESDSKSEYLSILRVTIDHKILRGVISSLIKKGYITTYQDREDEDTLITLLEKAIEYYK